MRKKRLLKIVDHLLHGQIGHEVFDFSRLNYHKKKEVHCINCCGTNGCAMGELPFIFPDEWEFRNAKVLLKKGSSLTGMEDIEKFFKISKEEIIGLFYPDRYRIWSETILPKTATKEEVAQGILDFISWKEKLKN